MIKGFVDHWCPTKPQYASWWNAPFDIVRDDLLRLMEQVEFDHFTFYTKWYTNGIYSHLPFLNNNPEASNVMTQNEWGRKIIDFLHDHGKSAGFMLQLLCFEPSAWGSEATISMESDCLGDISFVAPVEEKYLLADFAQELYQQRVLEIIREQVTEFPHVDYLFLEFEGLIINRKLSRYLCEKYGKAEPVSFSNKVMDHCHHVLFDLDHSWSKEFQQICGQHLGSLFRQIDEMLKKQGYAGKIGVVFYAWGYESEYMPDILPDPEWWLLPWDYPARVKDDTKLYVGGNRFAVPWDADSNQTEKFSQQRIAALKENLITWKRRGLRQCYIGNGTIAGDSTQITEVLYRLCEEEQLDGYLSMGTPFCHRGLRWPGFTPEDASAAAELYSRLYHR